MRTTSLWLSAAFAASLLAHAPTVAYAQDDDVEDEEEEDRGRARSGRDDRSDGGRSRGGRSSGGGGGRSYIERPHQGSRPFQLDVHAGFTGWGLGLATGVRFGIPLMDNGFIDSINNAVYLNFGADFYFTRSHRTCNDPPDRDCRWHYGPGFGFPVALHWEFYFSEEWSAFAELGAQFLVHPGWLHDGQFRGRDLAGWFVAAVGGSYHIDDTVLLTLRVGLPYIAFGATFQF